MVELSPTYIHVTSRSNIYHQLHSKSELKRGFAHILIPSRPVVAITV
jgi:hypothetical protein